MILIWLILAFAICTPLFGFAREVAQRIRDRAAHEVLDKLDLDAERADILSRAQRLAPRGFVCPFCGGILTPLPKTKRG